MDDAQNELVEVVAEDGTVERIVRRSEMRANRLRHRATFIAVLDASNRLLIHQRSPGKDVWPSRWDIAAGGCSAVGEPWELGARRELAEELGIDAALTELGGGRYDDDDVSVLGRVYVARHDGEVAFADGEVVAARWVSLDELDALVATEDFCPDSLELVLPLVRQLVS